MLHITLVVRHDNDTASDELLFVGMFGDNGMSSMGRFPLDIGGQVW